MEEEDSEEKADTEDDGAGDAGDSGEEEHADRDATESQDDIAKSESRKLAPAPRT